MIHGIGTDIADIRRFEELLSRHGERASSKILSPGELEECRASRDPARFLAKRFAAKEALGKAYGTGVRDPMLMPEISVIHDRLGKPSFAFGEDLSQVIFGLGLKAHLSLSDEREFAIAFVVLEKA